MECYFTQFDDELSCKYGFDVANTYYTSSFGSGELANAWNNIIAVYNSSSEKLEIYVNGSGVSTGTKQSQAVASTSQLIVGDLTGNGNNDLYGNVSCIYFGSFNLDEIGEAITYLQTDCPIGSTPASEFKILVNDYNTGAALSNFTVTISNSTYVETNFTTTGQIQYSHVLDGIYNLSITSNQSGGYFNISYTSYNVTSDLTAELWQSVINLNITDSLTGSGASSYVVYTNHSTFTGTNGLSTIYSSIGSALKLNITSEQYNPVIFNYSTNPLDNVSYNFSISPYFDFYLYREFDNTQFDFNSTNSTRLNIFCPTKNIQIVFNITYNMSYTVDCPYTQMQMNLVYPDGDTYFRTLVPDYTQQNVSWYLVDLEQETAVQVILELIDLTGDFTSGRITVEGAVEDYTRTIIEQDFTIDSSVSLFLLRDAYYTVSITNNDGTITRSLGSIYADAAKTITITYPNIDFSPDVYLGNNVSYSESFNISASTIRLNFQDTSGSTTLISYKIYNGTNRTGLDLVQAFSESNPTSAIFTFNGLKANTTYTTHLVITNTNLAEIGYIENYKVYESYQNTIDKFNGFDESEIIKIKKYSALIFLIIWGLLFSARYIGIGAVSTVIWAWILSDKVLNWIEIDIVVLGLLSLIASVVAIVEAMKR